MYENSFPNKRYKFTAQFLQKHIPTSSSILDLGVEYGIIKKSGSWFSYGDTKLGQGRDAVKALIKDNPDLAEELEGKIMEYLQENA